MNIFFCAKTAKGTKNLFALAVFAKNCSLVASASQCNLRGHAREDSFFSYSKLHLLVEITLGACQPAARKEKKRLSIFAQPLFLIPLYIASITRVLLNNALPRNYYAFLNGEANIVFRCNKRLTISIAFLFHHFEVRPIANQILTTAAFVPQ
ncbi:MAG: hypothetical protein LBF55_03430, partial [Prevotellaceae bacterium]|nr:hypothetical protein [Prevotellaceae bacterium]